MMRCLLDTQTLIWWTAASQLLSKTARDFLDDLSNELLLSIVTPWEISIKTSTGKLDATVLLHDLEQGKLDRQIHILHTEVSHVIKAGRLPLHHRDPFDRLLIAQALDLRIPIVSNNSTMDLYGVQRIWG